MPRRTPDERARIEERWDAVGSRERAAEVLLRARLCEVAREGTGDAPGLPSIEVLAGAIDRMRRTGSAPEDGVRLALRIVGSDPELAAGLRAYAEKLLASARLTATLADLGVLPAHGFGPELRNRVVEQLLPSHEPPHSLGEILSTAFASRRDAAWLAAIEPALLAELLAWLAPESERVRASTEVAVLRAIDLLAHRLAAAGEDRIVHDVDPDAIDHESPFLAQADHLVLATAARRAALTGAAELAAPEVVSGTTGPGVTGGGEHARVLLSQCRDALARIRRRAPRTGATVRLTYELERMDDLIDRLVLLLDVVDPDAERARAACASLLQQLAGARLASQRIAPLLARGSRLVAAEIVAHAGRTGGHYITRTPGEYTRMWGAAAGAGAIVAMLAAIKVGLASLGAPPLVEAAMFSANYALGFVVVLLLGLTIATKQPAFTAAALASSIDAAHPRDTRELVDTIACLVRSQLAAILGNVLVALPAAALLAYAWSQLFGAPLASPEKAAHLAHDLDPLRSGAIPHAALTGVWLALSGVAAGYVSNSVIARHVPARIASSAALRRRLGALRAERLAAFVEARAGAIAGCVVLGTLLGSTGTVGALLGLPIDIRHVSFASANLGLALVTLGPAGAHLGAALAGIAGIGAANLVVSFGLSLGLALQAKGRRLSDLPGLARDVARSLLRETASWLLPVGRTATPAPPAT